MKAFIFLACLLNLALFASPAHGQNTTVVTTVSCPAYARYGSKLYVVGGGYEREVKTASSFFYNSPTFVVGDGQFIVLDLSVSWKGSAPAWKKLQNGPKQYCFPGAVSADGNKMVTFHSSDDPSSPFAMLYDVPTDTWSPSKVQVPLGNRTGVGAVLNPTDGQVYLPSGYQNTLGDQMNMYNFATDTMSTKPLYGALASSLYYSGVWNSKTQTMLFFAGRVYPSGSYASGAINVYTPTTDSWSSLVTTGSAPGARTDQCIAISDDGSKFVVMGGRNADMHYQTYLAELFVLDLNTLVWTRAADYSSPRLNAVCTIYNNTFISWGGGDSQSTAMSAPAILYDLGRNKYLSTYMGSDPDSDYDSTMGPQKSGSSTPSGGSTPNGGSNSYGDGGLGGLSTSNMPKIIGGVFGGFVVLVIILAACAFCRKRGGYSARNQPQIVLDVFKDGQLVNQGHNRTGTVGEVTFVGEAAAQWQSNAPTAQRLSTMQTTTAGELPSPRPFSTKNIGQSPSPYPTGQQQYPLLNPNPSHRWQQLPSQTSFSDVRPTTLEQGSPQGSSSQAYPPLSSLPPLPRQPQQPQMNDAPPSYTDSPQLRSRQPEYVPGHGDGTLSSGTGSPVSWPMTIRSPELIPQ